MENSYDAGDSLWINNIKEEKPVDFILILPAYPNSSSTISVKPIKEEFSSDLHQQNAKCLKCPYCGTIFTNKNSFYRHTTGSKVHKCKICEVDYKCGVSLKTHVQKYHSKSFNCNQCSYIGKNARNLQCHVEIHIKRFICTDEECRKKFTTIALLQSHLVVHKHGIYKTAVQKIFGCTECDKTFLLQSYLKLHVVRCHSGNSYKCDYCLKVFKDKGVLRRHILMHVKVSCKICKKILKESTLKYHTRSHFTTKTYECDFCTMKVKTKLHLRMHMELAHSKGEYSCLICRRRFSSMQKVLDHNKIHIGIRQWKCLHCGKITGQKYNLTKHVEAMHKK